MRPGRSVSLAQGRHLKVKDYRPKSSVSHPPVGGGGYLDPRADGKKKKSSQVYVMHYVNDILTHNHTYWPLFLLAFFTLPSPYSLLHISPEMKRLWSRTPINTAQGE